MKNAAIIGVGAMGLRHLIAYKNIPEINIVAVCDINQESLNKIKKENPKINIYTNFKNMLEKEKIDIVSVATLGPTHAEIVIELANNKIPYILCEKPMATSVKDAEQMIQVCKTNNSKIAINHVKRFMPSYLKVKELIQQNKIGKISSILAFQGGGRLGSMGTHMIDLFNFLYGKTPKSIAGKIDKNYTGDHKKRDVVDPGGFLTLDYGEGQKAHLDVSENLGIPGLVIIVGSVGRMIVDEKKGIRVESRSEEDFEKRLGEYNLPLSNIEDYKTPREFVETITERHIKKLLSDEDYCTAEEGLRAVEVILATHISSIKNTKVNLPLNDKEFEVRIT